MQNEYIKYITFFSKSKHDKNNLIRKRKAGSICNQLRH